LAQQKYPSPEALAALRARRRDHRVHAHDLFYQKLHRANTSSDTTHNYSATHGHDNGRRAHWIPHAEHHDDDPHLSTKDAMIAGATAGAMEHILMFPVDTVKTRMQVQALPGHPVYRNVFHGAADIIKREGVRRLYRGIPAVVLAAIPSHAVYFGTYEFAKKFFRRSSKKTGGSKYYPIADAAAGAMATMAHDAVVTPLDVVKQRLQMYKSTYVSVSHAVRRMVAEDGYRIFYMSYPTTVVMNVPFMAVHFAAYEALKTLVVGDGEAHSYHHMIAGAGAGASGGLVSNPFDVIKTRLQTQGVHSGSKRYRGALHVASDVWKNEGPLAFFRGTTARVLYFVPSAAICWTIYELSKKLLIRGDDDDDDDHHHHHH
jgi:solute carrier family 25 (mitochondrial iron transporter), member 28/37